MSNAPTGISIRSVLILLAALSTAPAQSPAQPVRSADIPKPDLVGIPEEAAELVSAAYEAAQKDPANAEKIGELGMLAYRIARIDTAARCFEAAIRNDPDFMPWHYFLGIARDEAHEPAKAIAAFRKARELSPDYAPVLIRLANLLLVDTNENRNAEAAAIFSRARELSPTDARAYFGLAECARLRDDLKTAQEMYEKAVEIFPEYASAHGALAMIHSGRGDKIKAEIHRKLLNRGVEAPSVKDPYILELNSRLAGTDWLMEVASFMVTQGEHYMAMRMIERARGTKDFSSEAERHAGELFFHMRDYERAAASLAAFLKDKPSDSKARFRYARTLALLNRLDQAIAELRQITLRNPSDVESLEELGICQLRAGNRREAFAALEGVLTLAPERKSGHMHLIAAHIAADDCPAAAKAYTRALKVFESSQDLQNTLLRRLVMLMLAYRQAPATQPAKGLVCNRERIIRFSEALDAEGHKVAAASFRSYVETLAGIVERMADGGAESAAIELAQDVVEADEGGLLRDAISRLIRKMKVSRPEQVEKFLIENAALAESLPMLANTLAWIRATSSDDSLRNGRQALRLAEIADRATGHKNPEVLDTLAAAHAENGDFKSAMRIIAEALERSSVSESQTRIDRLQARLTLYEKRTHYRN